MNIIQRDTLHRGGFAGIEETRLIKDTRIGGDSSTWDGLGNFVYLADARYLPYGESGMHPHREVDVITVVLEGRLAHEGSLKHGRSMAANQAQAQRAGGEGFEHNEINPDKTRTRILQLWVLPENSGEAASYKAYTINTGELKQIYGGGTEQSDTLSSHTVIETGVLHHGQQLQRTGEFLLYIASGHIELNGKKVTEGDLIRGNSIDLTIESDTAQLTLVTTTTPHK